MRPDKFSERFSFGGGRVRFLLLCGCSLKQKSFRLQLAILVLNSFDDAMVTKSRVAPVRFGYGLGVERFERFRVFSRSGGSSTKQYSLTGKDGSGSGFGSWRRFQRFWFRFRLQEKFQRFWFPVPVRFLGHPAKSLSSAATLRKMTTT